MHQNEPHVSAPVSPRLRYVASLSMIATACFMMQALGCAHQPADHATTPSKSPTVEKHLPSGSSQPSRTEQSDKAKAVEKKSPASKEKKAAAATEKTPGKKSEQSEEAGADTLAPPPPLKPATFGGAGG